MPDFPRGLLHSDGRSLSVSGVEWRRTPDPLIDPGASGKDQVRSTTQRGFSWSETYDLLAPTDPVVRGFLADLGYWKDSGTVLDVAHPDITLLGAGGGAPQVAGADQTGSSVDLSGFPASTLVLRKGDFFRFTGRPGAYEVRADATTDGGGAVTVSMRPSIFSGQSPDNADSVILADTGVPFFKARIVELVMPRGEARRANLLSGIVVTFREAL